MERNNYRHVVVVLTATLVVVVLICAFEYSATSMFDDGITTRITTRRMGRSLAMLDPKTVSEKEAIYLGGVAPNAAVSIADDSPQSTPPEGVAVQNTNESSAAIATTASGRCTSQDDLRELISSTNQVLIPMPAKAAGTSLEDFMDACNGMYIKNLRNSFSDPRTYPKFLKDWRKRRTVNVVASHMLDSDIFVDLIRNTPRDTLLVYSHREEGSRLKSAIEHVIWSYCYRERYYKRRVPMGLLLKIEGDRCLVSEEKVLQVIKSKRYEIGMGANQILSCEMFDAIDRYGPNMVFMDYKRANEAQDLMAERYCRNDHAKTSNVASKKNIEPYIHIGDVGSKEDLAFDVKLRDWIEERAGTLESELGMNDDATCVDRRRRMEEALELCPGGMVHVKDLHL